MRCYNGCPDSELQAILDEIKVLETALLPNIRCTYFPMEQKYQMFVGLYPVGKMFYSRLECLRNWRNNQ